MTKLISKYGKHFVGMAIGAASGFAYWYFVGCASGHCAITSSPVNSTLYGVLMGYLSVGVFSKEQ